MSSPFTLKVYAPSGDPESMAIAARDDRSCTAVIFSRKNFEEAKKLKEFRQPGVYLLFGENMAYIGEGDPVGARLATHLNNKSFWVLAVTLNC